MYKTRYLTKSRFKLGMECPTKLFYTKKKEYLDSKMDDAFLAALAEGGFQVGELAKCYHPGGYDITTLDYEEAERQTDELLKQDKVIIYEPAIRFNNLFIRIDVLVKSGNHFELIEVKAKSVDGEEDNPFLNKSGYIDSKWVSYLYDIAFQRYVLTSKFPGAKVDSYLMLADTSKVCTVDGLNQKFLITKDESGRTITKVSETITDEDLKDPILTKIQVDDIIDKIYEGTDSKEPPKKSFIENIEFLAKAYEDDLKVTPVLGKQCADCEFMCSKDEEIEGYRSGFKECWSEALNWTDKDFEKPLIFELWDGRRKDKWIEDGIYYLKDLTEDDIGFKTDSKSGLSRTERQMLQVEKSREDDNSYYLDKEGLRSEMDSWVFPLHMIDFETSTTALPFTKGRRPYESTAFQFSHHKIYENGRIEHANEYLNVEKGIFPNFEFVRALKKSLSEDNGTVFRYSAHENTILNQIYWQLIDSDEPDKEELCSFIKTITKSTSGSPEKWEGPRSMVDLLECVKAYYFDPFCKGSNSIKYILPSVLRSSSYLQEKYSKPIYGTEEIPSLNFENKTWLVIEHGEVVDPYKQLEKLFRDIEDDSIELLSNDESIANGGAALTAYTKMQFSEMDDVERDEIARGLLRYCELDTFAMCLIYEAWREWLKEE